MQGACSNQVVKCIVYTSDFELGIEQLLKIEKEKNEAEIKTIRKCISKFYSEIVFDDGDEWIVVNPNDGAKWYRWRKAYVDFKNTTLYQLELIIKPCGNLYQWENYKLFNT